MQIGDGELDRRAIRRPRQPKIEILTALACLEEENDIARVQIRQGVQQQVISSRLLLRVELALLVRVRKERAKI